MENQLNSSGNFPRIYNIDPSQGDPEGLDMKEHRVGEFQRPYHLFFLCSTTCSGKRLMRLASRMPRKSRITRTGFHQDTGLFWVEDWKRSGTIPHMMDNGTVEVDQTS